MSADPGVAVNVEHVQPRSMAISVEFGLPLREIQSCSKLAAPAQDRFGSSARMRDRVGGARSSPGTVRRCQTVPRSAA